MGNQMVLVDTSVLIDYFKGADNSKTKKFEEIQNNKIPFYITNLIYLELLQGSRDEKEFHLLKAYLGTQRFSDLKNGKKSYEDAAEIYMNCRKKGYTIRSTIDSIISQVAIENDLYLLHNDIDYEKIAKINKNLKIY